MGFWALHIASNSKVVTENTFDGEQVLVRMAWDPFWAKQVVVLDDDDFAEILEWFPMEKLARGFIVDSPVCRHDDKHWNFCDDSENGSIIDMPRAQVALNLDVLGPLALLLALHIDFASFTTLLAVWMLEQYVEMLLICLRVDDSKWLRTLRTRAPRHWTLHSSLNAAKLLSMPLTWSMNMLLRLKMSDKKLLRRPNRMIYRGDNISSTSSQL